MKKIFTTLFLCCFIFSYVFCAPALANTYQAQPIVLNDNIVALNSTNQTQLYQNINGVFVPANSTQAIPTVQYQQVTTPSTQYQPAPVVVQPEQQVYTQTTTVTETVVTKEPSLGSKIVAGVLGTILVGGLITLAALTDDGPRHHHGGHKKGHSSGHKPPHRR